MDPSHVALIDISWPNSAFENMNVIVMLNLGLE
jgi:monomeric archaeal DNA polymerase sliding clamp